MVRLRVDERLRQAFLLVLGIGPAQIDGRRTATLVQRWQRDGELLGHVAQRGAGGDGPRVRVRV